MNETDKEIINEDMKEMDKGRKERIGETISK
jgi:hypothetical protein